MAMSREDRERNFEKALARNLRPEPPAEPEFHLSACPDAELLASYHERLLAPEQMISWKEHMARCSRCQEILAHLERTDEIPLGASPEEYQPDNILTMKESHLPAPRPKLRRTANWRWLAPAGALAAGLLLWVAFHEKRPQRLEMATNQPTPVAAPAAPPPSAAPSPAARQSEPREPKQAQTTRSWPERSDTAAQKKPADEEKSEAAPKQEAPVAPMARTKHGERDRLEQKSLPMNGRNVTNLTELSPDRFEAKGDAQGLRKQAGSAAGAATQDAAPSSGAAGAAAGAPAPAKSAPDATIADAVKDNPGSVTESVTVETPAQAQVVNGVSLSSTASEVVRLARSQSPTTVSAPDGKGIWRIQAAGIVEHSTDAGSTWTLQKTGVVADLTAGSAPSDKICWIVGRTGTILRTTDGGAHWSKVRSPVADDLSAVFAVDAQRATFSAASSHKSYQTVDAGRTWSPLSNP
jgi:hypothetical protein